MTYGQLLTQEADADRQAATLFDRIDAARVKFQPDARGGLPMIPTGFEAQAQQASDLRREAKGISAEAEGLKTRPIASSA